MTWFKVDDDLNGHPKARKAGLPAIGLWTVAGSWSSQQLTEGFVPDWYADTWPQGRKHAARLVSAGLWHRGYKDALRCGCVSGEHVPDDPEDGWQFHQFTERNPTADKEKERKAKARERQKRAREKAAAEREQRRDAAVADDTPDARESQGTSRVTGGVSHGPPDPTRPDPTRPDPSRPLPTGEDPRTTSEGDLPEANARATPPPGSPPTYPDHCPTHAHTAVPGPCGSCADQRKANATAPPRRLSVIGARLPCLVHAEPDVQHCRGCAADRKAAS